MEFQYLNSCALQPDTGSKPMPKIVQRTFTEIDSNLGVAVPNRKSCSIESYRDSNAYVLLGGPGAGKTTTFELESEFGDGFYTTARHFLRSSTNQALSNKTIFVDGLDELRAGEVDGRRPFDGILEKLDELGNPRFRLSCRIADWYGDKYRVSPGTVSPDGIISVLHINPLSAENVIDILKSCPKGPTPEQLIRKFQRNRVDSLLTRITHQK